MSLGYCLGVVSRVSLRYPQRFLSVASKVNSDFFKTPLYDFHVASGGKMVPYAGWLMPSGYDNLSVVQSVTHTRKALSLFDVSHMLQLEISGKDAEDFLETLLVSDLQRLKKGSGTLSLITNDHGGIIDDCIITRIDDNCFYLVTNAACALKDKLYLENKLKQFKEDSPANSVTVSELCDKSLIALQGPMLPSVMKDNVKGDMDKLFFMNSAVMRAFDIEDCRITRCGYTGEDGIEISVDSSRVTELCEKILKYSTVELAGLGCRDILRTEAGLCLYGHEISEEISPVESGLAWCIGKRRRKEGGFCGSQVILNQLVNNIKHKRVGLVSHGPLPRQDCKIIDDNGSIIGRITSGCPSPTLNCNIAMAYVPVNSSKIGNNLNVLVRNKVVTTVVSKLPFVPSKYYV